MLGSAPVEQLVVLVLMLSGVLIVSEKLGKYRFVDFVKVGGPLMLLTYVVTLVVTPLLFPFLP